MQSVPLLTDMLSDKSLLAFRTCFSSISYNGYKLDILKSGMQKYLRRREFNKMIWCVSEIYLFHVFAKTETEKRATKGIISNLLNRLIIMLDEEMLFAECEKYLLIRSYMEDFEQSNRGDFVCLYKICELMCGARMIRRNSDIRGYWTPNKWPKVDNGDGSDEYYFSKFKENFEKKNSECFLWMFKIFNKGEEGDIVRYRRKENIYMIWEYLFDRKNIKNDPILQNCLEYRFEEFKKKNRNERFIFLTASIDIAMYKGQEKNPNWFDCSKKIKFDIGDLKKVNDIKYKIATDILHEVFGNWQKMEIDDYAIDMHTSAGRKMGKNKVDFIASGAVVFDEDKEYFEKEWRDCYNNAKKASFAAAVALRKKKENEKKKEEKKKEEKKVEKKVEVKKKKEKTDREKVRTAKYKRIKKMRGNPKFGDLERNLENIDHVDTSKISLCTELTCGNKVMCFEYDGKIWKESRKSMNYNRDYCVLDECKELFGLKRIGMKRVLADFRLERVDKSEKSWANNWCRKFIGKDEEPVVYCVMDKIVPGIEIGKKKADLLESRKLLKEFVKIGVFRGIFRVSDFNGRNVLIKVGKLLDSGSYSSELVSIDEGDIGKRVDILGGRERWLIEALNKDKTIINEILYEINESAKIFENKGMAVDILEKYKFSDELIKEIGKNFDNLKIDLENEGIKFE